MKRVIVRTELIEFATLPIVINISPEQAYKGFEPYIAKIDGKVNLETISNILCQLIPNFTDKDVQVLFILYKVVVDGDISFLNTTLKKKDFGLHTVKARIFCLFLFLQNFRTSTAINKKEVAGGWAYNEGIKSSKLSASQFSPLNSPRSKAMRASTFDSSQNLLAFVKTHLPILLRLACGLTDFKSKDSFMVSPAEFDLLSCILSLVEDKETTIVRNLSDLFNRELDSNAVLALVDKTLSSSESNLI
jgi:hypothetical protein